jgi:hypothetical protein
MDNAEQNRLLTEAVERIMAARELAVPIMEQILNAGQDVVFLQGRKKVRKGGMILNFNASRNTIILKAGRNIEEVFVEQLVEIMEPLAPEPEDDEEGDEAEDEVGMARGPLPSHINPEDVPSLAADFARMNEMDDEERDTFARKVSGYTGPSKGKKDKPPF